jgi:ABC-type nitrate/sulfonate/bicarbonate transport system permease component
MKHRTLFGMKRRLTVILLEFWLPATLVVGWWFWSADSTSPFYPPLERIIEVFRETWLFDRFGADLVPSLSRFIQGFALACACGVSIGLALGLWTPARRALAPVVDFVRSVPVTALVSAFIVLLGFGDSMKVSMIAFASFFPILLNTIDGVRGVSPEQLAMARAYKVRGPDRIFRIILPAASPQIFAGLRVALAVALLVMAFSEMTGGTNGLGFFILFAQDTYRIPEMWSGIILLGLVGYAVNICFVLVERRVLRWHRGWRAMTESGGGAL